MAKSIYYTSFFFLNFRVHTGYADKSSLDSMGSVLLLDEIEPMIRSTRDFKEVLGDLTSQFTAINNYLGKYVMLTPGDWGVWYNPKKIICIDAQELPSSHLSIVPLVGQFHVGYNATMNSIQLFRFVHEDLGKYVVFGAHYCLAKKPKPFGWSLHVTLTHGGWLPDLPVWKLQVAALFHDEGGSAPYFH